MTRTLLRRLRPAALLLALMVAGCNDSSPTNATVSESVLSNVQIRPLTAQFSDRNVQYRLTATVTNPDGLPGGTAQLRQSTAEARRRSLRLGGPAVAQAPITAANLVGSELGVTLGFNRPPAGTLHLLFLVVDARGLESNAVPLVINIAAPPPTPGSSKATFVQTLGTTFQDPRCTNCHGFNVPNQTGVNHIGRSPTCSNCHSVAGWHAPGASFNLTGLSRSEICTLVKTKQGNNAAAIEDHLKNDLLIQWAIIDGTVLGNLQPGGTAPPGNLGTWNDRVDRWIDDGLKCD